MHANFDRVINVPVDSGTVSKTVTLLPRHPDDANIVAVQLKRKLEMKNSHLSEYIRPKQVVKSIEKLKLLGNPHYQDVKIDENFLDKENNLDDMNEAEETQKEADPQEPMDLDEALLENEDSVPETESQNFNKFISGQVAGPDEKTLDQQWQRKTSKKRMKKKLRRRTMETFYPTSKNTSPNRMNSHA